MTELSERIMQRITVESDCWIYEYDLGFRPCDCPTCEAARITRSGASDVPD